MLTNAVPFWTKNGSRNYTSTSTAYDSFSKIFVFEIEGFNLVEIPIKCVDIFREELGCCINFTAHLHIKEIYRRIFLHYRGRSAAEDVLSYWPVFIETCGLGWQRQYKRRLAAWRPANDCVLSYCYIWWPRRGDLKFDPYSRFALKRHFL